MKLILKIEAYVERDGGYYRNTPPVEIVNDMSSALNQLIVYIQEGSTAPRQVSTKSITLDKIVLEPSDYKE